MPDRQKLSLRMLTIPQKVDEAFQVSWEQMQLSFRHPITHEGTGGPMKRLFSLVLLSSFALAAAELTGKWSGKFDITNSDGEAKADSAFMNLQLEGKTVTGTAGPNQSKQWTIKDGKLEEGKLTFKVDMEDGGSIEVVLLYDGDAIRGVVART